jgi:hypothetical protein
VNAFAIVGNLLILGALGCGAFAVFVGGDARGALAITAVSLIIPGLVFRGVGRKLGAMLGIQPDFIPKGTRGTATITSLGDTGVTINNDPVLAFGLEVDIPGSPRTIELKQRMPRFLLGAAIPGSKVQAVADPDDPARVAIDWSMPPQPRAGVATATAVPGPGMEKISERIGQPVAGVESAAELLERGRHGTAVIKSASDSGDISDLGIVDSSDAGRDDRIYILDLEVKLPGRSPYSARVGHRVPERLFGRIGPGMEIEVAVDRDDDQDVAIDWSHLE